MARVGVIGSSNMDLAFRVSRLPKPGETLLGSDLQVGFGGKGANQAVTAARLGAEVVFLSCVGADDFGERMRRHYLNENIDTRFLRFISGVPTGSAGILVDDLGQNSIVVVGGANAHLSPDDIDRAADTLRSVSVLVAQLETPLETTLAAFRLARSAGVATILNPAPALSLSDEILALTDLCVPNESEAAALTSLPTSTAAEAETAARALLLRGCKSVILTRGAQGVVLVDSHTCQHIPAVPVQAVDTTAAGDAFVGALATVLANGQDLTQATLRARVVAALSVTRPGAQSSLPTLAEVEAFHIREGEAVYAPGK